MSVFAAGPQPLAQCSLPDLNRDALPDLNHDHPSPSVPRRTSVTIIAQCSLPDLNREQSTPSVPCRTSTTTIDAQCPLLDLNHDHRMSERICQKELSEYNILYVN